MLKFHAFTEEFKHDNRNAVLSILISALPLGTRLQYDYAKYGNCYYMQVTYKSSINALITFHAMPLCQENFSVGVSGWARG